MASKFWRYVFKKELEEIKENAEFDFVKQKMIFFGELSVFVREEVRKCMREYRNQIDDEILKLLVVGNIINKTFTTQYLEKHSTRSDIIVSF